MSAAPTEWAEVVPLPKPPTRGHQALVGPALLLALAVLIWLTGHRRRAVILVGVAFVLAVVVLSSPTIRDLIGRAGAAVGRAAAIVIGFIVLVPAYYLVVAPVALVMRLAGARPLDLSRDDGRASYWSARSKGADPRPRRMYTDQRGWHPVGYSPRQRRRTVVTTVLTMLLIQGAVLGGVLLVNRRHHEPVAAPPSGVAFINAPRSAALRDLDWAPVAYQDTTAVVSGLVYSPFTGNSLRDYHGTYVNVANRVRASYETPLAATQRPVDIWFFGGSTMFGFDLQRDVHTIPSEVVRLFEADGIAVRARNYGAPGLVNFQETVLLSLLASGGEKPDLVVFYDGVNDLSLGLLDTVAGLNPAGEPGELGSNQQRRALAASGEIPGASAGPPAPLGLRPATKPVDVATLAGDTVSVYGQGVDLARTMATRYGFDIVHFWQPQMYSKAPLDPGETELFPTLSLTPERHALMSSFSGRVAAALPSGVIDISDALNGVSGPVMSDVAHVNEKGGRAVAEAMHAHLAPEVARLNARG